MNREMASRGEGVRRVLVVEDNAQLTALLAEFLTGHGYEVIQARNGVEAMVSLTAPENEFPDVVLLDIGLPLESGVSVLSFVRQVMRNDVPVVVLTGRADPEDEAALRELGVSAYLRKPARPERVLAAIEQALA